MGWKSMAFAAGLMVSASAGSAEPRTLDVPTTAGWQHALTGTVLMPRLGSQVRRRIGDLGKVEYDIVASYDDPASRTVSTLYLFHPGAGSAPVWFDRVRVTMLSQKQYGSHGPIPPPVAFSARDNGVADSLRLTVPFTGASSRSSAVAVVPIEDWLLVVRMTSSTLDPAALDAALTSVLKDIRWPAPKGSSVAAAPVQPCADQLRFKRARLLPPDMSSVLMTATVMGVAADRKATKPSEEDKPTIYCRDSEDRAGRWGVYRAAGSPDGYIVALGDAGRAFSVGQSVASQLTNKGSGRYAIVFHDLDRSLIYPEVDRLPAPEQALAIIAGTSPSASTGPSGKQIQIAMPPSKSK